MLPTLDERVAARLDSLCDDFFAEGGDRRSPYFDFLAHYGAEALIHFHIMRQLDQFFNGNLSLGEFIKINAISDSTEYNSSNLQQLILSNLDIVSDDGLFIPRSPFHKRGRRRYLQMFNGDYRSMLQNQERFWTNPDLAYEILAYPWSCSDLADLKMVSKGFEFSRDFWRCCVRQYEYVEEGVSAKDVKWFPKRDPVHYKEPVAEYIEYGNQLVSLQ